MKMNYLISKSSFLAVLFLLLCPLSYTYAACCAGHGGVASCNKSTGVQMCKDGTASPTCKCAKEKAPKATPATVKKPVKAKPVTNTKPVVSKPVKSTPSTGQNRGCCSKHGGVAQCNTSTGYLTCKDGSQSASCGCH